MNLFAQLNSVKQSNGRQEWTQEEIRLALGMKLLGYSYKAISEHLKTHSVASTMNLFIRAKKWSEEHQAERIGTGFSLEDAKALALEQLEPLKQVG